MNPGTVVWKDGRPIAADKKEAKRISHRFKIIAKVLAEMGIKNVTWETYPEIVRTMVAEDFDKYKKFLKRVDELAKKEGC